ncbi:MAG TPA: hypothetical protein VFU93_02305 [Acidimicrobiales bacterium]|nr:hypothetical protein [Acidimicrobiales bacterium]
MRTVPHHVPPELVRDVGLDFKGPMDDLFPRLDALWAEGRVLARLELRIAMEEWHARIPDYRLDGEVGSYAGSVMGATNLPLRWE